VTTVNVGGNGQAIAGGIACDAIAYLLHDTGHLVPGRDAIHARRGTFLPTPQIGATHTAGLHFEHQTALWRVWVWDLSYLKLTRAD
jgi:hypothetical protein